MNGKKSILIVDDEPNNLAVLKQILQDKYELAFARDGKKALELAEANQPDLILLDIMMPDMDGYEVCERLKEDLDLGPVPVIFVTAMSDVANETKGFELGAVDYITKPVSAPIVLARVATHLSLVMIDELEASHDAAIFMLGDAGHYNDTDTGVHIWRMSSYARAIAMALGWNEDRAEMIKKAAAMHDTGKIGVPDAILKAPRKLTAEEWKVMQEHAAIGYKILNKGRIPLFDLAAEIALTHHERWDGAGYPLGLAGDDIPIAGRIVAVADVFDALTMKRPYKEEWPIEKAMHTLKAESGSHFDPELIKVFVEILPEILEIKKHWNKRSATIRGFRPYAECL